MKKMRKISNKFFEILKKYKVLNFLITKFENFYSVLPKNKAELKNKTKDLKQKFHEAKKLIKKNAIIFFNKEYEQEELNIARKPILIGIWSVLVMVFISVIWGLFVRIDSAAIAMGTVVVDSNRKTVQHFEGGIIDDILVDEGDYVKQNQILIKLNETSSKAGLEVLKKQMFALQVAKKRLEAERDRDITKNDSDNNSITAKNNNNTSLEKDENKLEQNELNQDNLNEKELQSNKLDFSDKIFATNNDEELIKTLEGEQKLFDTRNKTIDSQIDVLQQRIKQYEKQIEGLRAQEKSISNRITMARNELE